MKFRIAKKIGSYDTFLVEQAQINETPVASSTRDAMIQDVDTIITSLETLSKNLVEDLEALDAPIVDEKTKSTALGKMGQFAADFTFYGPKFAKMQKKVTTMEMNAEDLKFAARQEGLEPEKKAALKDKANAMKEAIKKLQKSIDDKATERGPWVAKTLSAAKIDGQLEVLKHMSGMTDDPNDQRTLKQRMQDLQKRKQEELDAMKELKDKNADDPEVKKREKENNPNSNQEVEKGAKNAEEDKVKQTVEKIKEAISKMRDKLKTMPKGTQEEKLESTKLQQKIAQQELNLAKTENDKNETEVKTDLVSMLSNKIEGLIDKISNKRKRSSEKTEEAIDFENLDITGRIEFMTEECHDIALELEILDEIFNESINESFDIEDADIIAENKFMDWLIYARRYRKLQQKINTMKMNAYDLGFAAANLGRSAENADKKAALNDKKRMLDDQIDDLQSLLDKKIGERGPYVKKVVDKTRIEGQIEMVKHMSGMSTDAAEKRSLAQRMKDLKDREQEETAAMAEYERQAKADAVDVKGDDELLRLKSTLDDARENLKKIDKSQDPIAYAEADLEIAQADLNYKVEKGDREGVAAAQEKVAKKQEAVKNAQEAVANQNQTTAQGNDQQHPTDIEATPAPTEPADPTTKLEADIAQYDTNIREEMARIVKLEADIKTATEEKSKTTSDAQRKSYEDRIVNLKAEIANSRADIEQMKAEKAKLVKQTATKEGLIVRAEELGLTELAESIASKEDWMLTGTKLYRVFEAEIVKAESTKILNESRYTTLSIKDRMNKLV